MPTRDDPPGAADEGCRSGNRTTPVEIRTAAPADELDARRLLDAALLEVDDVRAGIDADDVLVAVGRNADGPGCGDEDPESDREGRILGTIVLESLSSVEAAGSRAGAHVAAIAVQRRRRDCGFGTALIEAAAEREDRLTARFHERVAPFYASLGFEMERIDDERYEGVREAGGG